MSVQTHHLKTWPEPYAAVLGGIKTHEIRKDDRGYAVGDYLVLHEWDPSTEDYTGRAHAVEVAYVDHGPAWGLPANMAVMSVVRP